MIDFELEPAVVDLRDRVRAFVRDTVIPAEPRDVSAHGLDDALRREPQDEARRAGVFAPQVSVQLGGLGLDMRSVAVIFEEAGYSLLGPQALNCAAPDEGNMHLLDVIASPAQRERYLVPGPRWVNNCLRRRRSLPRKSARAAFRGTTRGPTTRRRR